MNKFIIVIVIIAVLGLGAYAVYSGKNNKPVIQVTQTPPQAIDTTSWKTYTATKYFTFKYPANWEITTSDVPNLENKENQVLSLKNVNAQGVEGKVALSWQDTHGGACPPAYEHMMLGSKSVEVCHTMQANGTENWSQLTNMYTDNPTKNLGIDIEATANAPYQKNRDLVLKILSTFTFNQ